jgi:hypothetical protein
MKNFVFRIAASLVFLGFFTDFAGSAQASTLAASRLGHCDYYDRLSASMHCSTDGYLVAFGARYCKKFAFESSRFSRAGNEIVVAIRLCLQKKLESAEHLGCANVGTIGFESHADCYAQGGFCEMDFADRAALASVVWPALLEADMGDVPLKLERACLSR